MESCLVPPTSDPPLEALTHLGFDPNKQDPIEALYGHDELMEYQEYVPPPPKGQRETAGDCLSHSHSPTRSLFRRLPSPATPHPGLEAGNKLTDAGVELLAAGLRAGAW